VGAIHGLTWPLTFAVPVLLVCATWASAQDCESGQPTSASGTIVDYSRGALADGWQLDVDVVIKSCDFEALWLREEPARECARGAAFVANGKIARGFEVTLDVETIVCIPIKSQTCSDGTTAEAQGTIRAVDEDTVLGGWLVTVDVSAANCSFVALWFRNTPPAQCAEGARFKARGEIAEADDILLEVTEIDCTPGAG